MKRLTLLSVLITSALILSACGFHTGLGSLINGGKTSTTTNGTAAKHVKATHTPPAPDTVSLTKKDFVPGSLTVKVGTTVTWSNASGAEQSVTSDTANLFDSGSLNSGATYTFTFSQAGTFTYHSSTTPAIKGTIVVQP
jgi:plastocyanin